MIFGSFASKSHNFHYTFITHSCHYLQQMSVKYNLWNISLNFKDLVCPLFALMTVCTAADIDSMGLCKNGWSILDQIQSVM